MVNWFNWNCVGSFSFSFSTGKLSPSLRILNWAWRKWKWTRRSWSSGTLVFGSLLRGFDFIDEVPELLQQLIGLILTIWLTGLSCPRRNGCIPVFVCIFLSTFLFFREWKSKLNHLVNFLIGVPASNGGTYSFLTCDETLVYIYL